MRPGTSSVSHLWRICGSGSVYTFAAWLFLYPFAVTILGGYDEARSGADRLAGFLIATGVHLLIGAGMAVGNLLERLVPGIRRRALAVMAWAVALGACRPLLIDGLQSVFHHALFSGQLPVRMATNVAVFVTALLVTATITTSLRRHGRVQRDLRATRAAIESGLANERTAVDGFALSFLADALTAVQQTLARTRPLVFDREREAAALRQAAETVARPMGHLAFDHARAVAAVRSPAESGAWDAGSPAVQPLNRPLFVELAHLRLTRAPAWIAPVLYGLVVLPYLLTHLEPGAAFAFVGAGIVVSAGANTVANRLTVPGASAWTAAAGLLLASVIGGALIAVSSFVVAAILGSALPPLLADLSVYPVIAVLVVLARSCLTRLVLAEGELAAVVREADRSAARARNTLIGRRESLARLLHTGVQGELTATALRVHAGIDSRQDVDAALARVEGLLTTPVPDVQISVAGVRENLGRIVAAWGTTIDIEFHAEDGVWAALAEDPDRSALVVDALSEAFGNVIRHADVPRAGVTLEPCTEGRGGVRLRVSSPGRLRHVPGGWDVAAFGYGLADLQRRGGEPTLGQEGALVVLTVLV